MKKVIKCINRLNHSNHLQLTIMGILFSFNRAFWLLFIEMIDQYWHLIISSHPIGIKYECKLANHRTISFNLAMFDLLL